MSRDGGRGERVENKRWQNAPERLKESRKDGTSGISGIDVEGNMFTLVRGSDVAVVGLDSNDHVREGDHLVGAIDEHNVHIGRSAVIQQGGSGEIEQKDW